MTVVASYGGFRIEIVAQLVHNAWDAGVRIRSPLSGEVRRSAYLPCRKATATEAEHAGELWARQVMDGVARLSRLVAATATNAKGRSHVTEGAAT